MTASRGRSRRPLRRGTVRVLRAVRRIWYLELAAVLLVAGLLVSGYFTVRDRVTPLTVEEALARFRSAQAPAQPVSTQPSVQPPGVYTYATDGEERIDVLRGARHRYPARTTITVVHGGCGLRTRWDALDQRWDEAESCLDGTRWTLRRFVTHRTFFQRTDRRTFRCAAGTLVRPVSDEPGTRWTMRCTGDDTQSISHGVVVGVARETVGGALVEVVHLRLVSRLSGAASGTRRADAWLLRSNGLLVRTTSTATVRARSVIGTVNYTERYTLRLLSLDPAR